MPIAYGSALTNGLPPELYGPASHLSFLLRASVRRRRLVLLPGLPRSRLRAAASGSHRNTRHLRPSNGCPGRIRPVLPGRRAVEPLRGARGQDGLDVSWFGRTPAHAVGLDDSDREMIE